MSPRPGQVLGPRALGRATLARQWLLERTATPALDAVHHLVGLQAQEPRDPYLALWSRLEGFDPSELSRLLESRAVVRIVVMRGTIHLVTGDDALLLRPLCQPVLLGELRRHPDRVHLDGVDLDPVLRQARALMEERPRSTRELRAAMAERFPDLHPGALTIAARNLLALVQVPPRGVWGRSAQVTLTTAEGWLGRPLDPEPSIDAVVLRYLAAFGPATVADAAAWSRLTGFRAVFERLRPRLAAFRDERGRELFDLPDAPRPDPDTPAPVRVLPEYDNLLLSHADRSRFHPERRLGSEAVEGRILGTVMHDGVTAGVWQLDRDGGERFTMTVRHGPLDARGRREVEAECRRTLEFLHAGPVERTVRLAPLGLRS